jgi:hypothetical protein
LRQTLTSPKAMEALNIGAFVVTSAALVLSVWDHKWTAAASFLFLLVVCVGIWRHLRRPTPQAPDPTEVFKPFRELDATSVWHRPADVARVVEAIAGKRDTVPLVVGSSGVGKSTLVGLLVEPELRERIDGLDYTVESDGYVDLRTKLETLIPKPTAPGHTVIVLDQFEQWLAHRELQAPDKRAERYAWLKNKLTDVQQAENYTIVLSLRREWYYDLRFLGSLVPAPSDACDIEGPDPAQRDKMAEEIVGSFARALDKHDGADVAEELVERLGAAGALSPLEAQIVGAVVERRHVDDHVDVEYFDKALGGVDGAVDAFFREILDGTQHRDVCHKVLCALSVKTRFREQLEMHQIYDAISEDRIVVHDAVRYLVGQGLLVEHEGKTYDLAHDYLAEFFTRKSAAELHPVERDNIRVLVEAGAEPNPSVLLREALVAHRRRIGGAVAAGLLFVMAARLLYLGVDVTLFERSIARPVRNDLVDSSYILIAVPQVAWIWYITVFYDRLLMRLKETPLERAYSIYTVLNLIVCIAVAIVIPFAWLLTIALGGIVFAGKLLQLASRPDMSRAAKERVRHIGTVALGNLAGVALFGIGDLLVSLEYVHSGRDISTWLVVNIALSAMMTYWCLVLTPTHTSRSGISQLLGLLARPGSVSR